MKYDRYIPVLYTKSEFVNINLYMTYMGKNMCYVHFKSI